MGVYAGYADPCDECLMQCDGMMDWSQDVFSSGAWGSNMTCTNSCYDPVYGECGGIWSDAANLHPCDACLIGCHEDPAWLDGEIRLGDHSCSTLSRSVVLLVARWLWLQQWRLRLA